jgi:hypothetical protein
MSISNLMTTRSEIENNKSNLTKTAYRQITPDRTVASNFRNGSIVYRWTVSGNSWWIPNKSFLSLRSKLYRTASDQPSLSDDIAPSVDFMACLFSSMEMRLNDQPLSRVNSFLPQISALKTRLTKSKAWRDSVGKSTNFWETDFERRRASIVSNVLVDEDEIVEHKIALTGTSIAISTTGVLTGSLAIVNAGVVTSVATALNTELVVGDNIVVDGVKYQVITAATDATGTTSVVEPQPTDAVTANANFYKIITRRPTTGRQRANIVETVFQPPLGVFDLSTPLPPGNYSFHAMPDQSNYNKACFESKLGDITGQDMIVEDMYFNAFIVDGENAPDDYEYFLDLNEIAIQPKALTASSGTQVLDFSVPPTTYAISVAVQEKKAGSHTQYSPTKFVLEDNKQNTLTQMRVTYAGQTQPSPDLQVTYSGATDHLTKMYVNTLMNAGGYDSDVLESKKEFLDMGWISHYRFLKASNDASSRADLALTLDTPAAAQALVFAHYSNVAHIVYKNRQVESVRLEYA